ncbi:hypothetical protein N8D56_14250 [Devosia sp. A8/3-2]|nr:hypothetical protein N8D56_14250 [Devosia sp. A8/3-2]
MTSDEDATPLNERRCTSAGCLSLKLSRQRSPLGLANMAGTSENRAMKKPISNTLSVCPKPLMIASPQA